MVSQLELGAEQGEHPAAFLLFPIPTSGKPSSLHAQRGVGPVGHTVGSSLACCYFFPWRPVDFVCVCLGGMWHPLEVSGL